MLFPPPLSAGAGLTFNTKQRSVTQLARARAQSVEHLSLLAGWAHASFYSYEALRLCHNQGLLVLLCWDGHGWGGALLVSGPASSCFCCRRSVRLWVWM